MKHEGIEIIRYSTQLVMQAANRPEITQKEAEAKLFGLAVDVVRGYAPASLRFAVFEGTGDQAGEQDWKEVLESDVLLSRAADILAKKCS